jgi:hypothetical protein
MEKKFINHIQFVAGQVRTYFGGKLLGANSNADVGVGKWGVSVDAASGNGSQAIRQKSSKPRGPAMQAHPKIMSSTKNITKHFDS